ncbi:hypothetical protein DL89DRAFT_256083 [Linderina pennispora]|uniref:Uncharacterized protein n=1 Tax=Linderina pennispora TaxID=61395 RepID=A0A1Y1WG59_9FUNG|nr:uncharacterized protein DL89DRAFT_256083 [Linderina pennispora]ORX72462.1 hypothetical protein DL89DRAFT_256083 [Linderina pennispora]
MNATSTLDFSQLDTAAAALEPTLRYTVMISISLAQCTLLCFQQHWEFTACSSIARKQLDEKAFVAFVELSRRALIKTIPVIGAARAHIGLVVILKAISEGVRAQLSKERYRTEEERDYNFAMKRGSDFAFQVEWRRSQCQIPRDDSCVPRVGRGTGIRYLTADASPAKTSCR